MPPPSSYGGAAPEIHNNLYWCSRFYSRWTTIVVSKTNVKVDIVESNVTRDKPSVLFPLLDIIDARLANSWPDRLLASRDCPPEPPRAADESSIRRGCGFEVVLASENIVETYIDTAYTPTAYTDRVLSRYNSQCISVGRVNANAYQTSALAF